MAEQRIVSRTGTRSEALGSWGEDIQERTFRFARQIIAYCRKIHQDNVTNVLIRQLIRAGTSVGANVQEARGGQSRADFIFKLSIAYKEAREAKYWLRLFEAENLGDEELRNVLLEESSQLEKILSSMLLTSKSGMRTNNPKRELNTTNVLR